MLSLANMSEAMEEFVRVQSNYSNGVIVEYLPALNGTASRMSCHSWLLLPAENLWSSSLRCCLYVVAIMYIFIGIAIGSDVFMTSIEVCARS